MEYESLENRFYLVLHQKTGPIETNCYLLYDIKSKEAALTARMIDVLNLNSRAQIIMDIVNALVSVDIYSELGAKQKHIIEYVKHPELL